ncbi:MAG: NAD(P)H-binding protein [Acidobacteria bacterium]|nr:NAD(P)H-binding protein [Acidobacteriota bacterium]
MNVFLTGSTGYMGSRLIPLLVERGHHVRALVRAGSEKKLPAGCEPIVGDALDAGSYAAAVPPSDTFVHLVGVPKPNPWKGAQFRAVDLPSIRAAVTAATIAGVQHFIYLSVAQPAPIMKDYIEVRAEGERLLRGSGMNATFLRPWYVLGPGHYWPYLLVPSYFVFELLPATRASAQRLGLVTLEQMLATLVAAVENPPAGVRIMDVPQIRSTVRK